MTYRAVSRVLWFSSLMTVGAISCTPDSGSDIEPGFDASQLPAVTGSDSGVASGGSTAGGSVSGGSASGGSVSGGSVSGGSVSGGGVAGAGGVAAGGGVGGTSDASVGVDGGVPQGDAGSDGGVAPDASTDASSPTTGPLCHLAGDEVGIIGDSYINFTDFTQFVEDRARKVGALGASDTYVDHALGGASMNGVPNIPSQWPDVVSDAKGRGSKGIKFVIMDGGGNDILVNNRDCLEFAKPSDITPACKQVVQDALDAAKTLSMQMKQDGVQQILFFFYPHLPKDSLGGGTYPNTILDYALPLVKSMCETQLALPCSFIDLVPSFDDGTGFAKDGLIQWDGIHPTPDGATIMADLVWKRMQDHCWGSK